MRKKDFDNLVTSIRQAGRIRQAKCLRAPFMGLFARHQGPPLTAGSRRQENRLDPFTGSYHRLA